MGPKHISLMLMRLKDVWGYVELAPSSADEWVCRSHTDEGIGGKYNFMFEGNSPFQATYRAYRSISRRYAISDKESLELIRKIFELENRY